MLIVCLAVAMVLVIRLVYIQVIKSEHYTQMAYDQQTRERKVAAKRGTIYDATGEKVLAQSVSVNIVTVTPTSIDSDKKEEIATKLAEILELQREDVLVKLNKKTSSETIASKVSEEKAKQVLEYISEEEISGIRVDEDTKRIYPYGTLAAHALGFVGTDKGLNGIEAYYEDDLAGIPGKIVGSTDGRGRETPFTNEQYIEPIDGKDLVLTIDATIQAITEKYLNKVNTENQCEYSTAVVLRPSTGEVLAIATTPTYDPNDPFTPYSDELKQKWDTMTSEEKNNALNDMWRNKTISNVAEPGSTFKIVTATAALEENVTELDNAGEFNCSGSMKIGGWTIRCWRSPRAHGSQSLRQGIMNSCNPVFMQVSQKIGIEKYCEYLKAFNLDSKTGIDLPGESSGLLPYWAQWDKGIQATMSYGYGTSVTAMQMLSAVQSLANNGVRITPHIIKYPQEEFDQKIHYTQVVSPETARIITKLLAASVNNGRSVIKMDNYNVAAKTGTSRKPKENASGYTPYTYTSTIGYLPASDPQVLIYVMVDSAKVGAIWGNTVAGPVFKEVATQVARIMNLKPDKFTPGKTNTTKEIL